MVLIDRNVIAAATAETSSLAALVQQFEQDGLDRRVALKKAARELGLSRAEAYRQLIVLKNPR